MGSRGPSGQLEASAALSRAESHDAELGIAPGGRHLGRNDSIHGETVRVWGGGAVCLCVCVCDGNGRPVLA